MRRTYMHTLLMCFLHLRTRGIWQMALVTMLVVMMGLLVVWQTMGEVVVYEDLAESRLISTSSARWLRKVLKKYDSRANVTTPELIKANGYPAETHHVTTEDGYILELHRIPCGIKAGRRQAPDDDEATREHSSCPRRRPVAFLHHCLLCSSSDFIMNYPDKALAYMLADAGYDVWLTNARGNTYSRTHVKLSTHDKEFWQFSWSEMALYDAPAAIDYILDLTGQKSLYYVGFSMGTTVFWGMLNDRPQYAAKIRFMVALGPVAYVRHIEGPLGYAATFVNQIETTFSLMDKYEMLSFGPVMDRLLATFCNEKLFTSFICRNILFLIYGPDPEGLNKEFLPVMLSHTPAGTSVRTVTHYLQEVNSGKFQKYDFGKLGNLKHYNSASPPVYNLSHVTTPVAVFWSQHDWLADPTDVLHLVSELPNVVYEHRVEDPLFTHLDFVWALHADTLVYEHLLRVMARY
ncbi:lipase 3 isoform X2 [Procambarus clarkii]|uniref:lipase 3 isoform X2 n=2 Tax=Procambarus clarkii TaxID=6728 RepID=UPI001E676990|nr:lipase 3-like isoform X2 [Procambarus clarkii]